MISNRFICTFCVAHVLYLLQSAYLEAEEIHLENLAIPFWTDILGYTPDATEVWVRRRKDGSFEYAMKRLGEIADKYMEIGKTYAVDGRMSEQIHR